MMNGRIPPSLPFLLGCGLIILFVMMVGCIVIYIAHKIYCWVYDYLPETQTLSTSQTEVDKASNGGSNIIHQQLPTKSNSYIENGVKAALRIFVSLDPCYLAYVIFETGLPPADSPEDLHPATSTENQATSKRLIKYFDRLSNIPSGWIEKPCPTQSPTLNSRNNDLSQIQ